METIYACTLVEKTASSWHPKEGAGTEYRQVMHEECDASASSLAGLVEKLRKRYALDLDNLWIPDQEETGMVEEIGYNQVEDVDSNELDGDEQDEFASEGKKMYLCDYLFHVEKRVVSPIDLKEFKDAGIKWHE